MKKLIFISIIFSAKVFPADHSNFLDETNAWDARGHVVSTSLCGRTDKPMYSRIWDKKKKGSEGHETQLEIGPNSKFKTSFDELSSPFMSSVQFNFDCQMLSFLNGDTLRIFESDTLTILGEIIIRDAVRYRWISSNRILIVQSKGFTIYDVATQKLVEQNLFTDQILDIAYAGISRESVFILSQSITDSKVILVLSRFELTSLQHQVLFRVETNPDYPPYFNVLPRLEVIGSIIVFSKGNTLNPANSLIYFYSLNDKKMIRTITGFTPQKVDDKRIVYRQRQGINEVYPYLMNVDDDTITSLIPDQIIGSLPPSDLLTVTDQGIFGLFSSAFESNLLFVSYDKQVKLMTNFDSFPVRPRITRTNIVSDRKEDLPAYLFEPNRTSKDGSVVIFIHGGGQHAVWCTYYGINQMWNESNLEIADLVEHGHTVLAISYFGDNISKKSDKTLLKSHEDEEFIFRSKASDDIITAVEYVKKHYPGKKIFLFGHSYGAYLVNMLGTFWADRADVNGIISFAGNWDESHNERFKKPIWDPIQNLSNTRIPFLVVHGTLDPAVNFVQMEQLENALKKPQYSGVKNLFNLLVLPDEKHFIMKNSSWKLWHEKIHQFINETR